MILGQDFTATNKSMEFDDFYSKISDPFNNGQGKWISFFENGNIESISNFEYRMYLNDGNESNKSGQDCEEEILECNFESFWEDGSKKEKGYYEIFNGGCPCGTYCSNLLDELKKMEIWGSIILSDDDENWTYKINEKRLESIMRDFYFYWETKELDKLRSYFSSDKIKWFGYKKLFSLYDVSSKLKTKFKKEDWMKTRIEDLKIIYQDRQTITISYTLIYSKKKLEKDQIISDFQKQYVTFNKQGKITGIQLSFNEENQNYYHFPKEENCCNWKHIPYDERFGE